MQKVKDFNKDLFCTREASFKKPIDNLEKLKLSIRSRKHKTYVEHIINNYSNILNATPPEMLVFKESFDKILPSQIVKESHKKGSPEFYKLIVDAMRYEALREREFPKFFLSSNIKSCVYCNAQHTLTIELKYYGRKKKNVKKVQSKLQLDHFYPKSKYPFLCTSFFNLYPTCANCNLAKGTKDALFELYTTTNNQDEFQFKIDDKSILNYWVKMDINKVKIVFESLTGNETLLKNHQELFKIQEIYDSNIDIAEELIIKANSNPESYRKILYKSFIQIFPNESFVERLLIGNYSQPEELLKRPYAKYTQDIARQLKLIN
ncbi:hypothetical protein ACH3O9_07105 [Leeuwenhoekiella sp. A16]|uniref:hypothetical protein n=1 Tax=Leeuwenhoekiella sp. A16 TaxID=3141462 RepID=UPI003A7FA789